MKFDKSKVFTSVNANEVKVGSIGYFADTYAELKFYVESDSELKSFVYRILDGDCFRRFSSAYVPVLNTKSEPGVQKYLLFYLLEEPKEEQYCPYINVYELLDDMLKDDILQQAVYHKKSQAFVFRLKQKLNPSVIKQIVGFDFENNEVKIEKETWRSLEDLFNYYTFLDDSPCGIKQ